MAKSTWASDNVAEWIQNDEGLYTMMRRAVRLNSSKKEAAQYMLDELQACGCEKTPDGANYTITSISAAMVGM